MNFAALPPEVTSGWMYSGPGAAPMLSAAAAWDQLAAELGSAASNYQAVIGSLIADPWRGPAATAMTAAAAPYAQWMSGTAEQVREVATQARAAAAAYQQAHAAVVPPPAIAANRANLQSLVATNIVGQNTPAITANQAAYGEMWAQNATAMYGYAGGSAAATTLSPLAEPPPSTDPTGQGNQAAAVGQAEAQNAGSQASNILNSMASGNPLVDFLTQINNFLENNPLFQAANFPLQTLGGFIAVAGTPMFLAISPIFYVIPAIFSWFPAIVGGTPLAFTISDVSGPGLGSTLVGTAAGQAAAGGGVSAGMGRAANIGGLSVPHTWDTPVKLAAATTALPAGAGMGGMPPIASVVNAPRGGGANPRNPLRSKIVGELGGSQAGAGQGTPDLVNPLTDKERAELDGLRTELTELVMEQDAVTRLMNQAFQA